MVEIGGRNPPPLPPNFVTLRQLRERRLMEARAQPEAQAQAQNPPLHRSSTEEKSDDRPLLPPNYVSLRQLRERRLKEEQEKENDKEKGKERESENRPQLPPDYVSLGQLQERRLEEEKEKENEEESDKGPHLPPNYVSLKQLQERRLKEKEKDKEKESDKGPRLPPNYVSLRQLQERRLKEEKEEKEAEMARLEQIKDQKKGDESGQIEVETNKNAGNLAKKPYKRGHMKSSWVWQPVLRSAGFSIGSGASSSDAVLVPENAGASDKVLVASSDQSRNAEMKDKRKKMMKKQNKRRISGKNRGKVVKGPEGPMEVTGLKIGEVVNTSNATKEVAASQNENGTVKKEKGKTVNLTESSSQSIPVRAEVEGFNGAQMIGFKMHNTRKKGKGNEVNLSGLSHNVVPVREVPKGSDGMEELIRSKIKNGKGKMGKGKMVNIPELSDQTPTGEEAKGVNGAGEGIGSGIQSGKEEKGRGKNGKNVNVPESSEWTGPVGGYGRMRRQAAEIRGRGHPRARSFTARAAEHLRGGGFIWVPKKST